MGKTVRKLDTPMGKEFKKRELYWQHQSEHHKQRKAARHIWDRPAARMSENA